MNIQPPTIAKLGKRSTIPISQREEIEYRKQPPLSEKINKKTNTSFYNNV